MYLTAPRGFRDRTQVQLRERLAETAASVQPLLGYTRDLAERKSRLVPGSPLTHAFVPQFDPAEAGVCARVLFLLEAPGPKTNPVNGGSGFISVDNNDQSAENFWRARDATGITEVEATHWNTVGWYLGNSRMKPTAAMRAEGAAELRDRLLPLFHRLDGVVAVGQHAQDAMRRYQRLGAGLQFDWIEEIPHSSPLALNQKGKRDEFLAGLRRVRERLGSVTACTEHPRTPELRRQVAADEPAALRR